MKNGNPNWKKGGTSPNPQGRRLHNQADTPEKIQVLVSRWLKKQLTTTKLNKLYNELDAKGKVGFITEVLPYALPRLTASHVDVQIEKLSDADLDRLYQKTIDGIAVVLPDKPKLLEHDKGGKDQTP